MRVFKNRWFHRWARKENLPDAALFRAAKEILDGKVEADLGAGLFKKRLARPGGGKRGGYRTIVGYKKANSERIIFLYAFAKNRKANMTAEEEAALSIAAESFISASDAQVTALLNEGALLEVQT